jgi:hypothetical protein
MMKGSGKAKKKTAPKKDRAWFEPQTVVADQLELEITWYDESGEQGHYRTTLTV